MAFKVLASLDADVSVAIGKTDKKTGKKGPNSAEGYYLGSRKVNTKKGEATLHFLQTPDGNLGVWGTTDMNRKLSSVQPGVMTRITFSGMKETPKGGMFTYKVEVDNDNTIEVEAAADSASYADEGADESEESGDDEGESEEEPAQASAALAAKRDAEKKKVEEIMKRGKTK